MPSPLTNTTAALSPTPAALSAKSLAILTYHSIDESGSVVSVSPQSFAAQMAGLSKQGFHGISLAEAIAFRQVNGTWPARSVVLTFDDGYESVYHTAWPVLQKHAFRATVFLISGCVGGRNNWEPPPRYLGERTLLSWRQVATMSAAGIEFGAHTRTHPNLQRLGREEIEYEMTSAKKEIEDRVGCAVKTFAYPFGGVSPAARACAAQEFQAACTTELSRATNETHECLPRVDMFYIREPRDLAKLTDGRLDNYLAIRRLGRRVKTGLKSASTKLSAPARA